MNELIKLRQTLKEIEAMQNEATDHDIVILTNALIVILNVMIEGER